MIPVVVLHGSFVDEFLIEIVLPLSIFGALYWWSSRREKKRKATGPPAAGRAPRSSEKE